MIICCALDENDPLNNFAVQRELRAPVTDEQAFHHAYGLFADALDILTRPPEEQCRLMCNFCVPTKLKQDIQAGEFLVGAGYLTEEQEAAIQFAVRAVDVMGPASSGG
jgi:hypothetical protein